MSRWNIERNGTGVERSGTGVEKSGTGIERSGTGIERSGTGIGKSGTGVERAGTGCRRIFLTSLVALCSSASAVQADVGPAGSLHVVVDQNTVAVSWIFDGSVFSGVASASGSYAALMLTEVAISKPIASVQVTGGGTGNAVQVTGGGTGNAVQVTGGGTGNAVQVTGGGTGGTTLVTGGGTGVSVQVTGGGTGSSTLVTGGGTGGSLKDLEGETGIITINPPESTGLTMEVSLSCGFASVSILDASNLPLATFSHVPVIGDTGLCSASGFGGDFTRSPEGEFRIQ